MSKCESTTEDPADLLNRQEDLEAELIPYYRPGPFFPSIQHPLVYSIPHTPKLNAFVNAQLRHKKQRSEQAFKEKDWTLYLMLFEKPHRLDAFSKIASQLSDKEYWGLLGSLWTHSENLFQSNNLRKLLQSNRPGRQHLLSEDEQMFFNALPETFSVYRGFDERYNNGFSWTLSPAKAHWFAQRTERPKVISGRCFKKDVRATFLISKVGNRCRCKKGLYTKNTKKQESGKHH